MVLSNNYDRNLWWKSVQYMQNIEHYWGQHSHRLRGRSTDILKTWLLYVCSCWRLKMFTESEKNYVSFGFVYSEWEYRFPINSPQALLSLPISWRYRYVLTTGPQPIYAKVFLAISWKYHRILTIGPQPIRIIYLNFFFFLDLLPLVRFLQLVFAGLIKPITSQFYLIIFYNMHGYITVLVFFYSCIIYGNTSLGQKKGMAFLQRDKKQITFLARDCFISAEVSTSRL